MTCLNEWCNKSTQQNGSTKAVWRPLQRLRLSVFRYGHEMQCMRHRNEVPKLDNPRDESFRHQVSLIKVYDNNLPDEGHL